MEEHNEKENLRRTRTWRGELAFFIRKISLFDFNHSLCPGKYIHLVDKLNQTRIKQ